MTFSNLTTKTNINVTGPNAMNWLFFSANAYGFNFTNSALTLNNGITNLSLSTQTFSNNLTLGGANTWLITNGGTIAVIGNISGGQTLTKDGAGTLIFKGVNTYNPGGNGTIITAGTLVVEGAGRINQTSSDLKMNGSSASLIISNGGMVSNSNSYVSRDATDRTGNVVMVQGSGSRLYSASDLYLGYDGGRNTMTVSNGAHAFNSIGYVGYGTYASNNLISVTGSGSLWSNRSDLRMGSFGSSNLLQILNGGSVVANSVTYNSNAGSNSTIIVSGSGSTLTNFGTFVMQSFGNLIISNGGYVTNNNFNFFNNSYSNRVLITGTGSRMDIQSDIGTGTSAASNNVTISNGGILFVKSNHYLSLTDTLTVVDGGYVTNGNALVMINNARSNTVLISGTGSRIDAKSDVGWFGNSVGYSSFRVSNNAILSIGRDFINGGNSGWSNNVLISSGGKIYVANNFNNQDRHGTYFGTVVEGVGSLLSVSNQINIGSDGAGQNQYNHYMVISNNGMVLASNIQLSVGSSAASQNYLTNSGGYLYVTNASGVGQLQVGTSGSSQGYLVFNGGTSVVDNLVAQGASQSYVYMNHGVLTTRTSQIYAGPDGGAFAIGRIANQTMSWSMTGGANVVSPSVHLGEVAGSTGIVMVSGPGTTWSNNSILYVGYNGHGRFTLSNNAVGNVQNDVYVGNNSAGSTGSVFQILDGSRFTNNATYVGLGSSTSNNLMVISGPGTTNRINDWMNVGWSGSHSNQLIVSNGGFLSLVQGIRVGEGGTQTGSSNSVLFNGGRVTAGNVVTVGVSGTNNSFTATNGSVLDVRNDFVVGQGANARSNSFTLRDSTLTLTGSAGTLYIGTSSAGYNTGLISNSTVRSVGHIVAGYDGNSNRLVIVDSVMSNALNFYVGQNAGSNNSVHVTNSTIVFNTYMYAGAGTGARSNLLVIVGSTVLGTNSGSSLQIGEPVNAVSNSAVILGSTLGFQQLRLGVNVGSDYNSAMVSNTTVNLTNLIWVGDAGNSNRLTLSNSTVNLVGGDLKIAEGTGDSNIMNVINSTVSLGTAEIRVGVNAAAQGNLLVLNNSSMTAGGNNSYLGHSGQNNRIIITNGGSLYLTNTLNVAQAGGSGNQVILDGATSSLKANSLLLSAGNSLILSGGTLEVRSGGTTYNGGAFTAGDGVQSTAFGMMGGTHNYNNTFVLNTNAMMYGTNATLDIGSGSITIRGTLNPGTNTATTGNGIGTLTFNDNLLLTATATSLLNFASLASFDRVVHGGGTTTAGGVINLTFDYDPLATDSFIIFQGTAAASGAFSATNWLGNVSDGLVTNMGNNIVVTNLVSSYIWTGGGADNNWSTTANWQGNRAPVNTGSARVVFATTPNTRTNSVVSSPWNIRSLTFSNSVTTNFYLTGNSITLNGHNGTGIVQNSASFQQIESNVILTNGAQSWYANSGELRLAGNVNITTNNLTLAGANNTTFTGALAGVTGTATLIKSGAGTLLFNGGTNAVGRLVIAQGTATLGNSTLMTVTNATANATILATNASAFNVSGATIRADAIVVTNGATWNLNSGSVTSTATIYSNTSTFVVGNGSSAATLTLNGGTHAFQNAVLVTNQGRLNMNNNTFLDNTSLTITNGGTLDVSGSVTNNGNVNFNSGAIIQTLVAGDILRVEGNLTNNVNFTIDTAGGASVPSFNGIELTGNFTNTGVITFNFAANLSASAGTFGNPYLFGIRATTDIFDPYYSGSLGTGPGSWPSSFVFNNWGGLSDGSGGSGGRFVTYVNTGGFYYLAVVPEPSTYLLIISGLLMLAWPLRLRSGKRLRDVNHPEV